MPGLIDSLTSQQQLEVIYIGYFSRAADALGFNFWVDQNTKAQAGGQSPSTALNNIANSFSPQPETVALYPFLANPNVALNTTVGRTALGTLVDSVYSNLFNRAADAAGRQFWIDQLATGSVALGSAILAISNGALGSDTTQVLNKITVALDFTLKTEAAGLGTTANLPANFLTAAKNALTGVDGVSLNDTSVTTALSATITFITSAATRPTFAITASTNSVNEGGSEVFNLATTGVAAGAVLPFTLSGTGITSGDIVGGALTGSFTVDGNGKASTTIQIASDSATEGTESLKITLNNGNASKTVTINDTSAGLAFTTNNEALTATELTTINANTSFERLLFRGPTTATVDVNTINTIKFIDLGGTGNITATNVTNATHLTNLTGIVNTGTFTVREKTGSDTFNLDLMSSSTSGASFGTTASGTDTDGPTSAIRLNDVKIINITSNGPLANAVVRFFKGDTAGSVDNLLVNITGSADLTLGSRTGGFAAFTGVNNVGETVNASTFTGKLSYASTGRGDTITGGSNNDTFFSSEKDVITTGAGADIVNVHSGQSKTGLDIVWIKDFAAGSDKIIFTGGGARKFFDGTGFGLDGSETVVKAAEGAFIAFKAAGNTEESGQVVEFKYQGKIYDAISRNGNFGTNNGYLQNANSDGSPENIIIQVTGLAGTHTVADFFA